MWGTLSRELRCPPVDDCPAASRDSGILTRGSESTSFYSTILVPSENLLKEQYLPRLHSNSFIMSLQYENPMEGFKYPYVGSYLGHRPPYSTLHQVTNI